MHVSGRCKCVCVVMREEASGKSISLPDTNEDAESLVLVIGKRSIVEVVRAC